MPDARPERRLAAGQGGAQGIPATDLLLHVAKVIVPPVLPSVRSAHPILVRRLTRRAYPLLHAKIGPLRCDLRFTWDCRHQAGKRAVRELHPFLYMIFEYPLHHRAIGESRLMASLSRRSPISAIQSSHLGSRRQLRRRSTLAERSACRQRVGRCCSDRPSLRRADAPSRLSEGAGRVG